MEALTRTLIEVKKDVLTTPKKVVTSGLSFFSPQDFITANATITRDLPRMKPSTLFT